MDIRSFLLTLIISLSVGIFVCFTLRDIGGYLLQLIRKHLIKPKFLKPYQNRKTTESTHNSQVES